MRTHSKVKGYCTERSAHLGTAWGLINSLIQLRKRIPCVCWSVCVCVCTRGFTGEVFLHYLYKSHLMQGSYFAYDSNKQSQRKNPLFKTSQMFGMTEHLQTERD